MIVYYEYRDIELLIIIFNAIRLCYGARNIFKSSIIISRAVVFIEYFPKVFCFLHKIYESRGSLVACAENRVNSAETLIGASNSRGSRLKFAKITLSS